MDFFFFGREWRTVVISLHTRNDQSLLKIRSSMKCIHPTATKVGNPTPKPTTRETQLVLQGGQKCVQLCMYVCTGVYVCVFVWHGWPEECSSSRLAEPSQWASSFTLQGNSTLIQRQKGSKRKRLKNQVLATVQKNDTLPFKTLNTYFIFNSHQTVAFLFILPVNWITLALQYAFSLTHNIHMHEQTHTHHNYT